MTDVAELSSNRHDGKHVSPEVALAMAIIERTEDAVIVKKLDGTVIAWIDVRSHRKLSLHPQ